ncbi:MAG: CAP domain-containing protein [Phycisphaeraceae bacterium]
MPAHFFPTAAARPLLAVAFALALPLLGLAGPARAQSDWDAYMLQLVNRARTDPGLENTLQGTAYLHAAVTPVAYDLQIAQAAQGHTNWMHLNVGNTDLVRTAPPRSFAHYQTHNGTPLPGGGTGTPLTDSPGFTGAGIGDRITATGFEWSAVSENIAAEWSSVEIPLDAARIETSHAGWWNSEGHRINMMRDTSRLFGHHAETRAASADADNNFPEWIADLHLATQNFARPQYWQAPDQYAFGLIYHDLDASADWTPRDEGDPDREGLGGVEYEVYVANTDHAITSGTTMDNGAFTIALEPGDYDLYFSDPALPGGYAVLDFDVAASWNTDLGNLLVPEATYLAGDMNLDGVVDAIDVAPFVRALTDPAAYEADLGIDPVLVGDINTDGVLDAVDVAPFVRLLVGGGDAHATPVPEPATGVVLLVGGLAMLSRRAVGLPDCSGR